MPLKFYISSFNLAKTHARPLTKIEKHVPYFCFPVYKRLYRSAYLTQSLVELLPILCGFSTKEGDIIRNFRVMKRNLERVTHVEKNKNKYDKLFFIGQFLSNLSSIRLNELSVTGYLSVRLQTERFFFN